MNLQPARNDGLPCYEVDGFGHYRHNPFRATHLAMRDWPTLWAVAVVDDVSRKYYLHDAYAERGKARDEARRIAALPITKSSQSYETLSALRPRDCGLRRNIYVRFEVELPRASVLFGPLSNAGLTTFTQTTVEEDALFEEVLSFQYETSMKLLRLATRGLRRLPVTVRRRVWSFAFTPRASPHPSNDLVAPKHLPPMLFSIDSYPKQIPPYFGRWIATMPRDATVNDVVRYIHGKLWHLAKDEDHADIYYDVNELVDACVKLSWPEPDSSTPRYIRQAKNFQYFMDRLASKDGLPHVQALASDRWTGTVDEFY